MSDKQTATLAACSRHNISTPNSAISTTAIRACIPKSWLYFSICVFVCSDPQNASTRPMLPGRMIRHVNQGGRRTVGFTATHDRGCDRDTIGPRYLISGTPRKRIRDMYQTTGQVRRKCEKQTVSFVTRGHENWPRLLQGAFRERYVFRMLAASVQCNSGRRNPCSSHPSIPWHLVISRMLGGSPEIHRQIRPHQGFNYEEQEITLLQVIEEYMYLAISNHRERKGTKSNAMPSHVRIS